MEEKNTETEVTQSSTPRESSPETNVESLASNQAEVSTEATPTTNSNKNLIVGIAVALLALGGGYWLYSSNPSEDSNENGSERAVIEKDAVVAMVNDVPIEGDALIFQMNQSAQLAGLPNLAEADQETYDLIKSQAIDAVVNTELLIQTAKSFGIEVTQEEVDAEYAGLEAGVGGEEAAVARLASLGVTVEEFKTTLVNDIYIRRYLEATSDETMLEVTDVEIENFYASVATGENVPPLEEVRDQIEEQLKFQKQQQAVVAHLEKLRETADIQITI